MKELEVELELLRLLVVELVEGNRWVCASGYGGGQYMIKWGNTMREMLGRAHFSLGGG